jgi:hypothetical protein
MTTLSKVRTAVVISVHDEPEPIRWNPPNVHPGNYLIPGTHADDKIFESSCVFSLRGRGAHQYARKEKHHGVDTVHLEILDAQTFIYTTGQQKVDEYGQKLEPDVQRFGMPIRAEEVANEIENVYGHVGMVAVEGEAPTAEEIRQVVKRRDDWMQQVIVDTNKYYKVLGDRQVTEQARRVAWELHKMGRLTPLPSWAIMNPSAGMLADTFNCNVCGNVLRNDSVMCSQCSAIYRWKEAVEMGLKSPDQVPPSKRKEAGLVPLPA